MNNLLRPLLLLLLALGTAHAAAPADWLGRADCRIAALLPRPVEDKVFWSGACKDGYADGKGRLEWYAADGDKRRLDATLVRGAVAGEGTLTCRGGSYTGSFRQGLPHGTGFFRYADGKGMYEGGVVDGLREGPGMQVDLDQSTYEGQWKGDKRHGVGKAVFTLGGSYEGEWGDDQFNGQGTIVYAGSGRSWTGQFRDGRAADAAPVPPGEPERFALKAELPPTGSNIRPDSVIGAVPHNASWAELTPAQQAVIRAGYSALDGRDEPPYPLKGSRPFVKAVAELYARFSPLRGEALLYVTVGADGVPTTANTYGAPQPELGRYLATIGMMQRFKPARCAGTPCAMIYPLKFRFGPG